MLETAESPSQLGRPRWASPSTAGPLLPVLSGRRRAFRRRPPLAGDRMRGVKRHHLRGRPPRRLRVQELVGA